ncbi:pyoverdine maturation tyrosinase PvdP [Pseudomonas japonica]|uniref:pyoverdine maturation tyrosinase PvdP n=1 Tax=Pseudomonas japonica TaxID=256466 RepID=UPI0015E49231|nr:PvdJ/PvdD/PvdP-like protein [Pseudomonas japonica]MBA1288713.1 PvdJ/PvdD/PvdP-like protein [Pseudomonas japonica]
MRMTRRTILAGAALGGLMVPVGYEGARRWKKWWAEGGTPSEARVELADLPTQRLADLLRGVWQVDAPGVPALHGTTLLLDAGERGRGLRGYVDTYERLASNEYPRFKVIGDLVGANASQVRWRLMEHDPAPGAPGYCLKVKLTDLWGGVGVADNDLLSGNVTELHPDGGKTSTAFNARKLAFPEARERIPLAPAFAQWLVTPQHRLAHQLWHTVRDKWHLIGEDRRQALRGLGWQPGPRNEERDSRGRYKDRNGSGIDFLYMHRYMLGEAAKLGAPTPWRYFPLPRPAVETDRVAFIRYFENEDGRAIPPTWLAPGDESYSQGMAAIKSRDTYDGNFQVWESRYRDPDYLAKMTLGQFGSELELSLHDWLHMCWASVARAPTDGRPMPMARQPTDFAEPWFDASNDFLGDPFSSHVHPLFWGFHGWIDARIDDWFAAHRLFHPGEVSVAEIRGVQWFAQGKWVEQDNPWMGPVSHACADGPGIWMGTALESDLEMMKIALRLAVEPRATLGNAIDQAQERPWYARNLPGTPLQRT